MATVSERPLNFIKIPSMHFGPPPEHPAGAREQAPKLSVVTLFREHSPQIAKGVRATPRIFFLMATALRHQHPAATPCSSTLQQDSQPNSKAQQESDSSAASRSGALTAAPCSKCAKRSGRMSCEYWEWARSSSISSQAPKRKHHSNTSTLQRLPAAAAPAVRLHLTAAPCTGTLLRRQQASSKTQTSNSSYTWSKNPNSFAIWGE